MSFTNLSDLINEEISKAEQIILKEEFKINKNHLPEKWTFNKETGLIDVNGNVTLDYWFTKPIKRIPVKFGTIEGDFDCQYCSLETLQNGPRIVKGFFNCDHNNLQTLHGAPEFVRSFFSCSFNKLKNLVGGPKEVEGKYYCDNNPELISLKGIPKTVHELLCHYTKIRSLKYFPTSCGNRTDAIDTIKEQIANYLEELGYKPHTEAFAAMMQELLKF